MPAKLLTDSECRHAELKAKAHRLRDGESLTLLVKPNGSKLWQYRYRLSGKENIYSIGTYPTITLAEARKAKDAARKLVAEGIHPRERRKAEHERLEAERKARAAERHDTVNVLVRDWLAHMRKYGIQKKKNSKPWTQARADRIESFLRRHLFPTIGAIPARDLEHSDVTRALDRVVTADKIYTARLCKQWLRSAYRWGKQRKPKRVYHDPTIDADVPGHEHQSKTPLKPDEIGQLWRDLEGYGAEDKRIGLRLLLLVFTRPSELREARWTEIDGATWRVPRERTKMRTEHVVPLAVEAQALLARLRELNGDSPFLFPGQGGTKPVSAQAWHACLRTIGWLEKFTPHAARATASTNLRELGKSGDWIEAQLAHLRGSEVQRAYDSAEFLTQRRAMMQYWSAYVTGLATESVKPLSGTNIRKAG